MVIFVLLSWVEPPLRKEVEARYVELVTFRTASMNCDKDRNHKLKFCVSHL
jgi:hypothetical protein